MRGDGRVECNVVLEEEAPGIQFGALVVHELAEIVYECQLVGIGAQEPLRVVLAGSRVPF